MRRLNPHTLSPLLVALALCVGWTLLTSGCYSGARANESLLRARFHLESDADDEYAVAASLPLSNVRIPIEPKAILAEFDYLSIEAVELDLGTCLLFVLKRAASRDYYPVSVGNQGKRLVLMLNGEPVGARYIDGPEPSGRIYMFVEATDQHVDLLAKQLKKSNLELQKKLSR